MVKLEVLSVLVALTLTMGTRAAMAEAPPQVDVLSAETAVSIALHHAPPALAKAHETILLHATIDHPELAKSVTLVYRAADGSVHEAPFLRSPEAPYVAMIPEDAVDSPGVAYAIEGVLLDGKRAPLFASREQMHPVAVPEDIADTRERSLLAQVEGRRSVVSASGEYVRFGPTNATVLSHGAGSPLVSTTVADGYYRIEGDYTYRLFGPVAEFGIRVGAVRGTSVVPNETDPAKFDVGLNYGAPHVTVRLGDWLHVGGEMLTSVTEVGFSVGGGATVLLGDMYGTHLTVGFESIQVFGTRGFSRFDIAASPRITVAPIIELTNMPHAENTGVRLLTEVRANVGRGFMVAVRGGYQARDAASGGPSVGGGISYAF